jgi:3-oxoacyl-[acyl-carrier protein] reductase
MTGALREKIAIVTGGSGGIGSAICERLSSEGATVVVHYSGHEAVAQQVVQNITANNGKAIAVQADLGQSKQVAALFDRTEQQFGTPDIVVNVAGVRLVGAIADMDDETFDKVFGLNAKGAFFCMRAAAQRLNDNGRIVNISSGLVVRPTVGYGLYVGSKAAIELMGKVLSIELGDRGITVNTVAPGPTETEQLANSVDQSKAAAAAAQSPFNRLGQPEDIADVVAFVVSDRCRWITGHTFQASGGYV